jgi:glutathione S-transferase
MLTLFGNLESGNVHKVAMLLSRLQLSYSRVDVAQTRGEPRQAEFLSLNPIGKVPALRFPDGDILTESGAILYFLAQGTPLWPTERRSQSEVLRWMFFEQYSHEPALAVLRYLRRFTNDPGRHDQRIAELVPKGEHALAVLEGQLQTAPFIAGASETIADLALYPYTAWADEAGLSLGNRPGIRRWLRLVESQPGFLPLMKDGAATSMSFADYCKRSALP